MGVPKFYRWLSERYPKVNQIVSDSTLLPEFDNLYLDMNGILHGCTHPNDDSLSKQLSERDIFLGIFHYIDRIVTHIVRPQRLLFMAIDGVAPRAKMNQQRSRRFRSAKDQAEAKKQLEQKEGAEMVDSASVFDSNCITPGTEFMAKVTKHLRYFIRKKIKEDPLWQNLTIIFSGHEVPGEGEHKIMQYIRDERHAGRFPPNTRHCMYGQDADLILLSLVSHEPHFTLLREVVDFGGNKRVGKNAVKVVLKTTRDAQFQLLHLSVLREYLWLELTRGLPAAAVAAADTERLVDDFVFMTFLVGNDFLPHMPSLDIGEEAFDLLFSIYRDQFPSWGGGYLTEGGQVADPDRFEGFLAAIGSLEDEIFEKRLEEETQFNSRRRKNAKRFGGDEGPTDAELAAQEAEAQERYEVAMLSAMGSVPGAGGGKKDFKGRYYFEKFGITPRDEEVHKRLRTYYLEGLAWCLAYYYKGCVSWSWFFPFHYVPMISDLAGLKDVFSKMRFELDRPFLPFQQLLGCLPAASSWCLPKPYAWLMTDPTSPIIDFYPEDFKIDQNGARTPWEAVNLLPFIDASRLFAAVRQHCPDSVLTQDERDRNTYGEVFRYQYDPLITDTAASCNYDIGLRDIPMCSSRVEAVSWEIVSHSTFTPALPADSTMPLAGFPSMMVLKLAAVDVRAIQLNVFGTASRYKTMVLSLERGASGEASPTAAQLAPMALGRSVFVNWPMMHEARVCAVSDSSGEYRLRDPERPGVGSGQVKGKDILHKKFNEGDSGKWLALATQEQTAYLKGRGTPGSGGADVGSVSVRLCVRPLQGMRRDRDTGALCKVWGKQEADVPLHLVAWSAAAPDRRFEEAGPVALPDRFPVGTRVLVVGEGAARGCAGVVVGYSGGKGGNPGGVDVEVQQRPPEPPFGIAAAASVQEAYYPAHAVCQRLRLRPDVFGRVTGSLLVDPGRFDLGLGLKATGRYQLLGYSRCVLRRAAAWTTDDSVRIVGSAPTAADAAANGERDAAEVEVASWEFSERAARLVASYMGKFPRLFSSLASISSERSYDASALLGHGGVAAAEEVAEWLRSVETVKLPRTPLTTRAMSLEAVRAVERAADVRQALLVSKRLVQPRRATALPPQALLAAGEVTATTAVPPPDGPPELGDRVFNISARGVPFGLWGTVVACHHHSGCTEVVWDEEFIGGGTLQGMCSNYRGLLVPWSAVGRVKPAGKAMLAANAATARAATSILSRPTASVSLRAAPAAAEPAPRPAAAQPSASAAAAAASAAATASSKPKKQKRTKAADKAATPAAATVAAAPAAAATAAPMGARTGHAAAAQIMAMVGAGSSTTPAQQPQQQSRPHQQPQQPAASASAARAQEQSIRSILGIRSSVAAQAAAPAAAGSPAVVAAAPPPQHLPVPPMLLQTGGNAAAAPAVAPPAAPAAAAPAATAAAAAAAASAAPRASYRAAAGPPGAGTSRGFAMGRGAGITKAGGAAAVMPGGLQEEAAAATTPSPIKPAAAPAAAITSPVKPAAAIAAAAPAVAAESAAMAAAAPAQPAMPPATGAEKGASALKAALGIGGSSALAAVATAEAAPVAAATPPAAPMAAAAAAAAASSTDTNLVKAMLGMKLTERNAPQQQLLQQQQQQMQQQQMQQQQQWMAMQQQAQQASGLMPMPQAGYGVPWMGQVLLPPATYGQMPQPYPMGMMVGPGGMPVAPQGTPMAPGMMSSGMMPYGAMMPPTGGMMPGGAMMPPQQQQQPQLQAPQVYSVVPGYNYVQQQPRPQGRGRGAGRGRGRGQQGVGSAGSSSGRGRGQPVTAARRDESGATAANTLAAKTTGFVPSKALLKGATARPASEAS